MRSVATSPHDAAPVDDRTSRARIRDAAIECFAEYGIADTTARKVAMSAEVSPALVIHHFGSMEGLRTACDEHVADAIRRVKESAMASGPGLDIFGLMRETNVGSAARYLARILDDNSPTVETLIDDLVADAVDYLEQGVESGMLRPSDDPRGRAVVLVLWSLGGLVLHEHFRRLLGIDLTDPDIGTDPNIGAYVRPAYEILGTGIFTKPMATQLRSTIAEVHDAAREPTPTTPPPRKGTR